MSDAPDAELVVAAREGDAEAFGTLFDRWFDRVHDVAWRIVRDRDTSLEVAQDVFLVAWQRLDTLEQPASFGGWVLRVARNRALNRLARERRTVALGDEETRMEIDRRQDVGPDGDATAAAAVADEHGDLVWAAAAALGPRDASLLDLHLRHGMGAAELSEALEVTPNNAHQLLFRLKGKLERAIRAWVLWRGGHPACDELSRILASAGVVAFDAASVPVITRHAARCEVCADRQRTRLSPQAMFAAVPLLAVGPLVKARAAAALAADGVPIEVPTALRGDPGTPDGGTAGQGQPAGPVGAGADGRGGFGAARGGRSTRSLIVGAGVAAVAAVVVAILVIAADPAGDEADPALDVAVGGEPSIVIGTAPLPTEGGVLGPAEAGPAPTTTSTPEEPPAPEPTQGGEASTPAVGSSPDPTGPTDPAAPSDPAVPEDPVEPGGPRGDDTTVPVPAPTIAAFRVTAPAAGGPGCTPAQVSVSLVWASQGAETATVDGPGAPTAEQPPTGGTTVCAPAGDDLVYQLTVAGPGGTASRTAAG